MVKPPKNPLKTSSAESPPPLLPGGGRVQHKWLMVVLAPGHSKSQRLPPQEKESARKKKNKDADAHDDAQS
jgi:hypothetical protein